jgi:hypothetical protein
MNLDFHYYATYIAARDAAFTHDQALLIAHAAQYVDCSSAEKLDKNILAGRSTIPTFETMLTMSWKTSFRTHDSELKETEKIWTAFHFLPGNLDSHLAYSGPNRYSGWFSTWSISDKERQQFKLLCLPNSGLSEEIVNACVRSHNKPYFLHQLGICMHVLADTWAHRYYSGVCCWCINDAHDDVIWTKDKRKVPFVQVNSIETILSLWDIYRTTPSAPGYESYAYLGHGRMGHLPDSPFADYTYTPMWSNTAIRKDNPADYMSAYKQLVMALKNVRAGTPYKRDTYAEIASERENDLRSIFADPSYSELGTPSLWQKLIQQRLGVTLPNFDENKWLEEARRRKEDSDYLKFNDAAYTHASFVQSYISSKIEPHTEDTVLYYVMDSGYLPDGRMQIFEIDSSNVLCTSWAWGTLPDSTWQGMAPMANYVKNVPSTVTDLCVDRVQDSRLQLFVIDTKNTLWTSIKRTIDPNADWIPFEMVSNSIKNTPAALIYVESGQLSDGRLQLFVIDSDKRLWTAWQISSTAWCDFMLFSNGIVNTPQVVEKVTTNRLEDGRLEIYVLDEEQRCWISRKSTSNSYAVWTNFTLG